LEASAAFTDYAKNNDMNVEPAELVKSWAKVQAKVAKMGQDKHNGLLEKVADYLNENYGKKGLTEKQAANVGEFVKALPHELRISFWSKVASKGTETLALTKSIHQSVVPHILDVFGVPMGAKGVGVVPTIPGFMQDKK
jgi:hypothetical protein